MIRLPYRIFVALIVVLSVPVVSYAQGFFSKTVPIKFSPPKDRKLALTNLPLDKVGYADSLLERELRRRGSRDTVGPDVPIDYVPRPASPSVRVVRRADPGIGAIESSLNQDGRPLTEDQLRRELEYQIATGSRQPLTAQQRQLLEALDKELRGESLTARDRSDVNLNQDQQASPVEKALRELISTPVPGGMWGEDLAGSQVDSRTRMSASDYSMGFPNRFDHSTYSSGAFTPRPVWTPGAGEYSMQSPFESTSSRSSYSSVGGQYSMSSGSEATLPQYGTPVDPRATWGGGSSSPYTVPGSGNLSSPRTGAPYELPGAFKDNQLKIPERRRTPDGLSVIPRQQF